MMRLALMALAVSHLRGGSYYDGRQAPEDLFGGMFGPLEAEEEAAEAVVVDEEKVLEEKKEAVEETKDELKDAIGDELEALKAELAEQEEDAEATEEVIE